MAEISWDAIIESCGASFDSIRNIVLHSLQAEHFWIRRLSGKDTKGIYGAPFDKFTNLSCIEEYTDKVEKETKAYLNTLTNEKLDKIFEFKRRDDIKRHRIEDILMKLIEEEK